MVIRLIEEGLTGIQKPIVYLYTFFNDVLGYYVLDETSAKMSQTERERLPMQTFNCQSPMDPSQA